MKNLILIVPLILSLTSWADVTNTCDCPGIAGSLTALSMTTVLSPNTCNAIKHQLSVAQSNTTNALSNDQGVLVNLGLIENCSTCCPTEEDRQVAAQEASDRIARLARETEAAGQPGVPKASNLGGESTTSGDHNNEFYYPLELRSDSSCSGLLDSVDAENSQQITITNPNNTTELINKFKPIPSVIDLEDPRSFIHHFMGANNLEGVTYDDFKQKVTASSACRIIASGCSIGENPVSSDRYDAYKTCIDNSENRYKRPVLVGLAKSLAIVEAADASTKFVEGDDFGGVPFECRGNRDGLAFDYPKCKSFYGWYVGLEATGTAFRVGNEAAVITSGMRNQTRLQRQVADGNGQDAGLEAARLQSVEAQQAEERNMAFFSAKGAAILAQLRGWPSRENICSSDHCALFTASGADRIGRNFFPNAQVKNQIYAQAINATSQMLVASMKAGMHKANARKVQTIKEQMQFADESDEGVMKFCVQFPQDVRCLSPGERRGLGASGTQFGSFQGTNFGLGSLEGEQASDINAGQNFDGNLGAAGGSGSVANIGDANKEAAAAKDIFRAPPAARGGGGGGGGAGAGGGGGGGGSAQSGQLSRDEGLNEEKKQNPIEITSKKAAYEGSKGGYNGGGYKASNKKPEPATANPFASMFGKDKGRDPANVAEIDKPASDLFAKISRRYGEVQKRKGLIDVGDEGQSGLR